MMPGTATMPGARLPAVPLHLSSTCCALQDLDTDNPHIELNGFKYTAKYEDTVGSLLVCSSTAAPDAPAETAAAEEDHNGDEAMAAAAAAAAADGDDDNDQAQEEAKKADISLVVCEKRLVAQLLPTEPSARAQGAAAAAPAAGSGPAASGGDAASGDGAAEQGAGDAADGDAQEMEVE